MYSRPLLVNAFQLFSNAFHTFPNAFRERIHTSNEWTFVRKVVIPKCFYCILCTVEAARANDLLTVLSH